jgi:hypothetical protein
MCHTRGQVTKQHAKPGLAALLLAALFAVLGCAASPNAGLAIARPQAGIVWVDESRPPRQEARENTHAPVSAPVTASITIHEAAAFDAAAVALDSVLFQRPPPFLPSIG